MASVPGVLGSGSQATRGTRSCLQTVPSFSPRSTVHSRWSEASGSSWIAGGVTVASGTIACGAIVAFPRGIGDGNPHLSSGPSRLSGACGFPFREPAGRNDLAAARAREIAWPSARACRAGLAGRLAPEPDCAAHPSDFHVKRTAGLQRPGEPQGAVNHPNHGSPLIEGPHKRWRWDPAPAILSRRSCSHSAGQIGS